MMASHSPSRCSSSLNSMSCVENNATFDSLSEPKTMSSNFDDFEFETSRGFYVDGFEFEKSQNFEYLVDVFDHQEHEQHKHQHQHQQHGQHGEMMAFADELFCNGKVIPLKLPPGIIQGNSPTTTRCSFSPMSPSSVLKLPFHRQSLWNDDFDPFLTALENVKEEKKRGRIQENDYRRARSMSPLRTILPLWSSESSKIQKPDPNEPIQSNGSQSQWGLSVPNQYNQMGPQYPPSRRVELSSNESAKEGSGSNTMEGKKQGIKGFLFRSATMDRECKPPPAPRGDDQSSITVWKTRPTKRFSFKSIGEAHCNEKKKKRVAKETKTIIQYRPKLFLCLGFGYKVPKK